jgi:hypothetical protein
MPSSRVGRRVRRLTRWVLREACSLGRDSLVDREQDLADGAAERDASTRGESLGPLVAETGRVMLKVSLEGCPIRESISNRDGLLVFLGLGPVDDFCSVAAAGQHRLHVYRSQYTNSSAMSLSSNRAVTV